SAQDPVTPAVPQEDVAQRTAANIPVYRNIHISNVTATSQKSAGTIIGLPESRIADVVLENVHISAATTGLTIRNAEGIRLKQVQVTTTKGPPFIVENAQVEGLENAGATAGK